MKKILLVLTALAFLPAQSFGFNFGFCFANIDGFEAYNPETDETTSLINPGVQVGFITSFDLSIMDLDLEANFNMMTYDTFDESSLVIMNFPATARLTILPLAVANIFVRGGIQYEAIVNNKLTKDDELPEADSGLALVIGAGMAFEVPDLSDFLIELRFTVPQYDAFKDIDGKGLKVTQGELKMSFLF